MQGCAPLQDAPEPHPMVFCFSSAGQWEPAAEPLHRLWESFTPVHQRLIRQGMTPEQRTVSDAKQAAAAMIARQKGDGGFGPGLAFGRTLTEITGRPVGLLPCAHGGTTLAHWWHDQKTTSDLYGAMLERVRRAGGHVRGLLWYQGESDAARSPEEAARYGERLTEWIQAVRNDLEQPELPVLIVQLAPTVRHPSGTSDQQLDKSWTMVRQAQLDLPRHVPWCACVCATDLGLWDTVHIDGPSQNRLGRRLAIVMARFAQGVAETTPRPLAIAGARHAHPQLGMLRVSYAGVTGSIVPRRNIQGFSLRAADGATHPTTWVLQASVDPDDPASVLVSLNQPAKADDQLAYGYGEAPFCNATDETDLALPAFLRGVCFPRLSDATTLNG